MALCLICVALLCLLLAPPFSCFLACVGRRRASSRLGVSSGPHLKKLATSFGSKSKEYLVASEVVHELTEEALKEAAKKDKEAAKKDKAAAAEKDKVINMSKEVINMSHEVLSLNFTASQLARDLMDASTVILQLKGKLDVRGMIEEVEISLSPGKIRDPNTSRTKLWAAASEDTKHAALFSELAAGFPSQGESAKEAAITTIKDVYKKASEMIHKYIGSNNVFIVLRHCDFPGSDEQHVIRTLAKHFHFKLEEQPL